MANVMFNANKVMDVRKRRVRVKLFFVEVASIVIFHLPNMETTGGFSYPIEAGYCCAFPYK